MGKTLSDSDLVSGPIRFIDHITDYINILYYRDYIVLTPSLATNLNVGHIIAASHPDAVHAALPRKA